MEKIWFSGFQTWLFITITQEHVKDLDSCATTQLSPNNLEAPGEESRTFFNDLPGDCLHVVSLAPIFEQLLKAAKHFILIPYARVSVLVLSPRSFTSSLLAWNLLNHSLLTYFGTQTKFAYLLFSPIGLSESCHLELHRMNLRLLHICDTSYVFLLYRASILLL